MSATRTFHLGDILSVTTERLVSPRHMGGIYGVLNWMTGDNLATHQLPRACDECQESLLAQHPDLRDIEVPEEFGGKGGVDRWLAEQVARFGETREVAPLADGDRTHIDPLAELQMMRPDAEHVVIVLAR